MTCVTLKQTHAQPPFKTRKPPSDRGVVYAKLSRRAGDAARP
jgi:hypothetical protein